MTIAATVKAATHATIAELPALANWRSGDKRCKPRQPAIADRPDHIAKLGGFDQAGKLAFAARSAQ